MKELLGKRCKSLLSLLFLATLLFQNALTLVHLNSEEHHYCIVHEHWTHEEDESNAFVEPSSDNACKAFDMLVSKDRLVFSSEHFLVTKSEQAISTIKDDFTWAVKIIAFSPKQSPPALSFS